MTMQYARFLSIGKRGPDRRAVRRARLARAPFSHWLAILTGLSTAPARPAPLPAPNTGALQPSSAGTVRGFILDAQTRRPIPGARVRVEEGGAFAPAGPTVARTDSVGQYTARAQIGRSWKKIDWIRVFTSF